MSDAAQDAEEFVLITASDTDEANRPGEKPEVVATIKSWLAPTEFVSETSEYQKHLNAHVQGTGQWILETEQYKRWYETDAIGDIWIRGIPGSGKSVVAANLIRELKTRGDAPVLFFFFRQIILSNRTPQSMLRDCSFQLLDYSPFLQSSLRRVMKKYPAIDQVPFDEVFKSFSAALSAMEKVYCVIDALDEMDLGQDAFLADFLNLGRRYPKSIKLALTSRQLPYLESHFRGSCLVDLRLDRINVDNDIATYISHRLKNFQAIIMPEEAHSIKSAICDKGKGLFLYARLMMDECIRDPKRFMSQQLPNGLGNMYSDLLLEHAARSGATQAFQKLVLEWVTHSQRPLRLIELTAVINSMSDRGGLTELQDTKTMVRSCCGPLLEVCEDEVVQIIHHSFTEFLCGSELSHVQLTERDAIRFPVLEASVTHAMIAISCLNYLKSGCLDSWPLSQRYSIPDQEDKNTNHSRLRDWWDHTANMNRVNLESNFLPYAAEYWPIHASKTDQNEYNLSQGLDDFISDGHHDYESWKDIWSGLTTKTPKNFTPLHLSAHCGLRDYTKALLLRGMDPNIADGFQCTPLSYAATNGHHEVVTLLLEYQAKSDIVDGDGHTPLHNAAKLGHAKALQALLLSGADPMAEKTREDPSFATYAQSTKGNTALYYICHLGHLDALLVLLQYLDLDTVACKSLHWAAERNQPEILAALLQHESIASHIDDRDDEGNTALYLASRARDPRTVKTLLDAKADVNARSCAKTAVGRYREGYETKRRIQPKGLFTPLHGWARLENTFTSDKGDGSAVDLLEVLDLLIAAGCGVDERDELGRTALFGWNKFSYTGKYHREVFVSSLLRHGADPRILNSEGGSVLHELEGKAEEKKPATQMIESGADINLVRRSDGQTPLISAAKRSSMRSPQYLHDLGAHFNLQDKDGNTAFHYACSSCRSYNSHLDLWVSLADVTIQNNVGRLAVSNLDWGDGGAERIRAIEKMVERGMDLETRDHLGRTPLLQLFCNGNHGNQNFFDGLLKLGANAKAKDNQGKSALHLLATSELSWQSKEKDIQIKYETMESLIKAGCKLNARDNAGNNIFHDAISWNTIWPKACSSAIAITKLGADVNSTNHKGRTALHNAAGLEDTGSYAPEDGSTPATRLDFILRPDLMFNVRMVDLEGIAPIHIAAQTAEINVRKLIKAGADIYATDIYGRNPLHYAAAAGKCNVVDLLVSLYRENFFSLSSTDIKGRTPLHEAAKSGNRDSVVSLILAGADINSQDERLRTPLHAAAEFEYVSRARLRQRAFDSNKYLTKPAAVDTWGITTSAFDKMDIMKSLNVEETQIREVVRLLLSSGADPGHLDISEHTPSDVAVMLGNAAVVHELAPSMTKLYDSKDSGLQALDPFGEMILAAADKDFVNLMDNLDFDADPSKILERAISYGNDAIVEVIKAKKIPLVKSDGSSPLHLVAKLGMTTLMEKLLPCVEDINASSPPLLHTAVQRDSTNTEMLHVLINAGANVDAFYSPDGKSFTVLHVLATGSRWWFTKALTLLLDAGADPEITNAEDNSALQVALSSRSAHHLRDGFPNGVGFWGDHVLNILLDGGAKINTVSPAGLSPLNTALASSRGQRVLKKLLDHGADGGFGAVPAISSAIDSLDMVSLRMLLEAGANPNVVYTAIKVKRYEAAARLETPLFNAATPGSSVEHDIRCNMIDLLLKYGADPLQSLDGGSSTLLHEIVGLSGCLTPAMIKGIDLEIRDSNKMTLLLRACKSTRSYSHICNRSDLAIFLVSNGADVHAVDANGCNALHHAVESDLKDIVNLLLEKGVSPVAKNNDGFSPFSHAVESEYTALWAIEPLLKAGADPKERFLDGKTPLHFLAPCMMKRTSKDSLDKHEKYGGLDKNPEELLVFKELYKRFIALGCDPEEVDDEGNTPIFDYVATTKRYNEVSSRNPPDEKDLNEMFATHDIFKVNHDGDGLLHVIAKREEEMDGDGKDGPNLFKMLVDMGLDPRLENKKGVTPLDVAAACENQMVLDFFARKD